jgi:hypothetical protein
MVVPISTFHLLHYRSIASWGDFIRCGSVPDHVFDARQAYSAAPAVQHRRDHSAQERMQLFLSDHLGTEDKVLGKLLSDEFQAAQMMLGMQHSAVRESVSLRDPNPWCCSQQSDGLLKKDCDSDALDLQQHDLLRKAITKSTTGSLIEDETMCLFQQLQSLTGCALELQVRYGEFIVIHAIHHYRLVFQVSSQK